MEDPLKFFISELESNNQATKVNAIHRINIILTLIGVESSKKHLLPIIENIIKKEDDEVLFALAEVLSKIGITFKSKAIQYLEILLESEETLVREKAYESTIELVSRMNSNDINTDLIPMINRLIKDDKKFMSKISGINIIVGVYKFIQEDQRGKFKSLFQKLFTEESSMVKKALASKIGDFCENLSKEEIISEIIPFFKKLSMDDQDQVKILTIESLPKIGKHLSKEDSKNSIIPIIIDFTSERNWRIKIALSQNYYKFAQTLGKEITETSLISIYSTLLRDGENEVRVEAVRGLKLFIKEISNDKLNSVIPYLQTLSTDTVALVRVGVCEILSVILKNMSPDVIKSKLKNCIVDLFKDKDLEVKIEIIQTLSSLAKSLGNEFFDIWKLIDKNSILNHMNWRVRSSFGEQLIKLSKLYINNMDNFNKYFYIHFSKFFEDKAESVRNINIKLLNEIGNKILLDQKVLNNIMNDIEKVTEKSVTYKLKISGAKVIFEALPFVKSEFKEKLFDNIIRLLEDKVENVRYSIIALLLKNWNLVKDSNKSKNIINLIITMSKEEKDYETKLQATNLLNKFGIK